MHVICGLPRSGSTLLCNILNQNPLLFASSTSNLCQAVFSISQVWSNNPETKYLLHQDRTNTEHRMRAAIVGFSRGWYTNESKQVVFDKGRHWNAMTMLFNTVWPEGRMICLVRDPREIFASTEKQHRRSAMVSNTPEGHLARATELFKPDGLIGGPVHGVEEIIRAKPPHVRIVQFDQLVTNPDVVMMMLYNWLGLEPFKHDFDNVKNVAQDPDGFYLHKFPHKGEGKVEPPKESWQDYVSEDVAQKIVNECSYLGTRLGYW